MKYLSTKTRNIILTILVSILCTTVIIYSGVLDDAGMAAIIVIWLPAIIGVVTIVAYLITTLINKKYAPILTIIGNLLNLLFAISAFWN